jgi:hypothetical protein
MRNPTLPTLLFLLIPLNGCSGQPGNGRPSNDQTTSIVLKMEDSKASRRGKLQLTDEELKDPEKLRVRLAEGWPKEELIKRGVLEADGHKYYLYLPKAEAYSIKNTNSSDADSENTSTLISVDQKGDGRITDADGWFANLPLRLGDKMYDVTEIAADASRIVLKPSKSPLRGVIVGRTCPPFSFKTADGKVVSHESLAKKPFILDIWSIT